MTREEQTKSNNYQIPIHPVDPNDFTEPELTSADKFARIYDYVIESLHSTTSVAILDLLVFVAIILKLSWPALNSFIVDIEGEISMRTKFKYLAFLTLFVLCLPPFFCWPITYCERKMQMFRGLFANHVFHTCCTVANVILVVRFQNNPLWAICLLDIPLFVHTVIVFSYHNYSNQISGRSHKKLKVLNAYITRPLGQVKFLVLLTLEYMNVYQGYYSYRTHASSSDAVRKSYLAFAAFNSFLLPVAFTFSATIGATTNEQYWLKKRCCGFLFDVRRNFVVNLLGFMTDLPILIVKIVDHKALSRGGLTVTIFVFNWIMCIKALVMGLCGLVVIALTGCDNGICDCYQLIYRNPLRCCKDVGVICKAIPTRDCPKAFLMSWFCCCFSYRDICCPCFPEWLEDVKEKNYERALAKRVKVVPVTE